MEKKKVSGIVGKYVGGFFMNAVLMVFSISCIFPLVWMFYSSFKEKEHSMRIL